ncbi:MAG: alpha/beta fold hydrolase, partial [Rhodopirellula bahusiensis]
MAVAAPLLGQEASERVVPSSELLEVVRFSETISGESRLLSVPENRLQSTSRQIYVHYIRIPARKDTQLPPVVFLPGGPGQTITCEDIAAGLSRKGYSKYAELAAFGEARDVVIINQSGTGGTPGHPDLPRFWLVEPPVFSKPLSADEKRVRLARGLHKLMVRCGEQGIDVRGYNLGNMADDVEAIRLAHGYARIAIRGTSFGSQWALAYLSRYPNNIDRMLLSGVEPVDYGYDSPNGFWNVIKRIDAEARASEQVVLPDVGLAEAVKTIITRLEAKHVTIRGFHPRKKYAVNVPIGADDFRHYLLRPILDSQMHSRAMLALWPKFIAEIYNEDYQYLASKIVDDRPETTSRSLHYTLIDNSIGISEEREATLNSEMAARWLGDVNLFYTATRSACPIDPSAESLRRMADSPVPVLLVHGTLDLATPLENSLDVIPSFPNGKLLTVVGGTHAAEFHAAG